MSLKERLNLTKEPLYLIDGTSFFYRGFYAYPDLKRSDGFPTNAIFIVLRILLRMLREEQPKYVGFFMDGKGPTFRHELFDQYKAHRPRMPEALADQVEPLREAVRLMGLHLIVSDGSEADDCIAALADRFKGERPVVILGSDKDLKQCLAENVYLWDPASKQEKITGLADFIAETGLRPDQWPDFQALTGDSADNIPGIPGVGPKTALKIMADFPTLEDVRDRFDELPKAFRKKAEAERENIFTYRELTRLRTDVCPGAELDDFKVDPGDLSTFRDFLETYEFHSLKRDLPRLTQTSAGMSTEAVPPAKTETTSPKSKGKESKQLSLFGEAAAATKHDGPPLDVREVDAGDLAALAGRDVGMVVAEGGICLGTTVENGENGEEWLFTGTAAELAEALASAARVAVPSLQELLRDGDAWRAVPVSRWYDLSLAAYLLSPEDRGYGWDRLKSSLQQDAPEFANAPRVHPEAEGLAALAYMHAVSGRMADAGLDKLMRDLEMPLIPVLVDMERAGIGIDTEAFAQFLDEVSAEIERLTKTIHEQAGSVFNIRSSQQLAEVLFDHLGLKPAGKTPGGALSTANDVLEKLSGRHPIVDAVLDYRKIEKLRSTYLEPLPKLRAKDGRIHTHFNQLATATGRLSSSGPNLQNIPIRGEFGGRMRSCFTADSGNLLASADYSQVELRVLAHFSQDPELLSAFRNDEDIHTRTAALLLDKDPVDVRPDDRRSAKTINFGLIYGMGPQKLSRELGITLNEAKEFIERYFAKLGTLKTFYDEVLRGAEADGFVTTLAGRRRLLPDIHSRNNQLASQAKRQAFNAVIQGSAADIIKMAMLRVHGDEALRELDARLLLQVHDELLIEAPEKHAEKAGKRLQELMQTVVELDVPLKVDLGIGPDWGAAH